MEVQAQIGKMIEGWLEVPDKYDIRGTVKHPQPAEAETKPEDSQDGSQLLDHG